MRHASTAFRVALIISLVSAAIGAWAQTAPAPAAGAATTAAVAATPLDEKLAAVDKALAEFETKLAELAALKAELEAQKTAPPAAQPPKTDRWNYVGYMQAEAYFGPAAEATGSSLQYRVRRFFNTITYQIDSKTTARLLLNTSIDKTATVAPLDAWIERADNDYRVRFGQFIAPVSLDMLRSSQFRHAHDYSRGYEQLFRQQRGQGMYETGILVSSYSTNKHAGQVGVAMMTGNGTNARDNDNAKNITLYYTQPFANGKGTAHLSWTRGRFTEAATAAQTSPPASYPVCLLSFGGQYVDGQWEFGAETIRGRSFGAEVCGGYAEAAYTTGRHTLFGRYDAYDPNTAIGGNRWIGPSLGYEYNWNARNRLSFELGLYDDQAAAGSEVRYQARWQTRW